MVCRGVQVGLNKLPCCYERNAGHVIVYHMIICGNCSGCNAGIRSSSTAWTRCLPCGLRLLWHFQPYTEAHY